MKSISLGLFSEMLSYSQRFFAPIRTRLRPCLTSERAKSTSKTQEYMDREDKYGAHNYAPLPVVLAKGEGIFDFVYNDDLQE